MCMVLVVCVRMERMMLMSFFVDVVFFGNMVSLICSWVFVLVNECVSFSDCVWLILGRSMFMVLVE